MRREGGELELLTVSPSGMPSVQIQGDIWGTITSHSATIGAVIIAPTGIPNNFTVQSYFHWPIYVWPITAMRRTDDMSGHPNALKSIRGVGFTQIKFYLKIQPIVSRSEAGPKLVDESSTGGFLIYIGFCLYGPSFSQVLLNCGQGGGVWVLQPTMVMVFNMQHQNHRAMQNDVVSSRAQRTNAIRRVGWLVGWRHECRDGLVNTCTQMPRGPRYISLLFNMSRRCRGTWSLKWIWRGQTKKHN